MNKDFYIYEWYNIETNEVFYVGKGRKNRYKNTTQRNKYFKNYYEKHNCDVRKVASNLSEDEAFLLETELISKYKNLGQCKTNLTTGGEGCTYDYGTWNDLFRRLQFAYCVKKNTYIMDNEEDYNPKNLKNKSLEELTELYEDFEATKDAIYTFNSLQNEIGWEHVWED